MMVMVAALIAMITIIVASGMPLRVMVMVAHVIVWAIVAILTPSVVVVGLMVAVTPVAMMIEAGTIIVTVAVVGVS